MKRNSFIIVALLLAGCHEQQPHMRSFDPQTIFSAVDAQLILGERTSSIQSNAAISPEGLASCTMKYAAITSDSNGRTATLTFVYDELTSITEAENLYASIAKQSENVPGVKILNDIGDQAYSHSDDTDFCYLLVRKDNKTFHMTVNPITKTTALDEFYKVAKRIADSL